MVSKTGSSLTLRFQPLTPELWPDLEALFGEHGACGGCWCMWWRLTRAEFEKRKGQANKEAFRRMVESGETPGVLAYAGTQAVGWCAVAPRETYSALERSRILKRVDSNPVWSVVCFFVARPCRRKGVTVQLLKAAIEYAREHGARIVEGYPVEPKQSRMPDPWAYTGVASAFREAGFVEVLRRSGSRPIMRYVVT